MMHHDTVPNVLLVSKNFDIGGTETHVRILANTLSDREVHVVVASKKGRQEKLLNTCIPFSHMDLKPVHLFYNFYTIAKVIRKHDIGLIHAHSRRAILFSTFVSLVFNIPLVVTIHGRVRYDLSSRLARLRAKTIIIINRNMYEECKQRYTFWKKMVAIPNGSIVTNLVDRPRSDTISFLYAGRMDRKHFHALKILIHAFQSEEIVNNASLKIVGDGQFATELQELIEKSAAKNISYVGYQKDPSEFLKNIQVVIGVGRVATDGLFAGKAVYTLNGAYCGQLVTAANFTSLAQANFVNTKGEILSEKTVKKDIENIIRQARSSGLPGKEDIGLQYINSLSFEHQVNATLKVYLSTMHK